MVKKVVPRFPPETVAGRKSYLLSIEKEVGHGETECSDLRTLEFFQFILNKVSFSDVVW